MSFSRKIEDRLLQRRGIRRGASVLFLLVTAVYLTWRITIFNGDAPILSSVFYFAEIIGLILCLTTVFVSLTYRHRELKPAPKGLSVDVFVLTYKEPVDLLRRTLRGAIAIDYPHQTWLLDDGNRPEMRALADELGVRYLARERNLHAKAGNINNALQHSVADFFVVFDADHIPMRHSLEVLLGFVDDPLVAQIQAPQDFYNTTAFQYMDTEGHGGLWHDQSYFYNVIQSCKDAWNASTCIGTSVAYRRAAIDAIGGIPTETVTEDMHTSLLLHRQGWRSIYINESVAYGIGAVDLGEYYKTRLRWGFGNIHVLRHENILTCSGLTLTQRLAYLTLGLIYLEGWQQLIMYSVPIYSLLTGVPPFEITIFNVLAMIGYPFLGYILLQELGCGYGRYWLNEMFGMIRFPIYIAATFALFRDKLSWRSSSKALKGRVDWKLMAPQLAVLALSLIALGVGIYRNLDDLRLGPLGRLLFLGDTDIDFFQRFAPGYNLDLLLIAGFWATFNVVRCSLFIIKVLRNARESHSDYRFRIPLALEFDGPDGAALVATKDISLSRLTAALPAGTAIGAVPSSGRLILPSGTVEVELEDARLIEADDGAEIEAKIAFSRAGDSDRLADCLYSVDWHRGLLTYQSYFKTPLEFLGQVLPWNWPKWNTANGQAWRPAVYRLEAPGGSRLRFAVVADTESGQRDLVAFEPIPVETTIAVREICDISATWRRFSVMEGQGLDPAVPKALDGTIARRYTIKVKNVSPIPAETVESAPELAAVGG